CAVARCKAPDHLTLYRGRLVDDRRLHLADHFSDRFAVLHLHVASHDGVNGHAFDLPATPWRRMVLAVEFFRLDGAFLVHIDDGEIAVGAEPDRPFLRIHLPDLGDIFALYLDVVIERHAALVDLRQQQGDVGFNTAEAGDAVPNGGFGHLTVDIAALFFERVGRMVSRDHVDRAVQQALPQRVLVLLRAHRRGPFSTGAAHPPRRLS